jgi:antirestriction protein
MNTKTECSPRIYVACLASYNSGILYGKWIDASDDADTMQYAIDEMIEQSPTIGAEEWSIHDFEGLANIGESDSMEDIALQVEAFTDYPNAAVIAYIENFGGLNFDHFEDAYFGSFTSMIDIDVEMLFRFMDTSGLEGHSLELFERYCDETKIIDAMKEDYSIVGKAGAGSYHIFRDC